MVTIKKGKIADAVSEYQSLNKGGMFDPIYGYLMLDRRDGDVWVDMFCSIGHNDWMRYHSNAIVNLGFEIESCGESMAYQTVLEYGTAMMNEYNTSRT